MDGIYKRNEWGVILVEVVLAIVVGLILIALVLVGYTCAGQLASRNDCETASSGPGQDPLDPR